MNATSAPTRRPPRPSLWRGWDSRARLKTSQTDQTQPRPNRTGLFCCREGDRREEQEHVAIVGATGAVGREFVGCIESRGVPLASLKLLASARSAGKTQTFRGKELVIEELTEDGL